jgi:sarcosine oxidase, subunit gamma
MAEPLLVLPRVTIIAIPSRARLVLRGDPAVATARVAAAFGVAPPAAMLTSSLADGGARAMLRLGPDEWWLLAEDAAGAAAAAPALAAALEVAAAHEGDGFASVVDVSHRHCGFALSGPGAAALLNEGCPLDLDPAAFPPGACTRGLFGKVEILLWRRATDRFEVETGRSFAAALQGLLAEAASDLDTP